MKMTNPYQSPQSPNNTADEWCVRNTHLPADKCGWVRCRRHGVCCGPAMSPSELADAHFSRGLWTGIVSVLVVVAMMGGWLWLAYRV